MDHNLKYLINVTNFEKWLNTKFSVIIDFLSIDYIAGGICKLERLKRGMGIKKGWETLLCMSSVAMSAVCEY